MRWKGTLFQNQRIKKKKNTECIANQTFEENIKTIQFPHILGMVVVGWFFLPLSKHFANDCILNTTKVAGMSLKGHPNVP